MERLTEKFKDGRNILRKGISDVFHVGFGRFFEGDAVDRLAEYEDLEEQGKLLKLPCKLGDTTFWISDEDENGNKIPTVRENNPIAGIAMQEDGLYILSDGDNEYQKAGTRWAFLTREEAEAALKEL